MIEKIVNQILKEYTITSVLITPDGELELCVTKNPPVMIPSCWTKDSSTPIIGITYTDGDNFTPTNSWTTTKVK
jgi:hypothetical protein